MDDKTKAKELRVAAMVNPVNYLACILCTSFLALFLIYLGYAASAYLLLVVSFVLIPLLAARDRVEFDGRRVRRTGAVPKLWARLTRTRDRLKISDIEQVHTTIVRTVKRGGNLIYVYRTAFQGKGKTFAVRSSRPAFRKFVGAVLPLVDESVMDARSIDLRDHLDDRVAIRRRAKAAEIPAADVLDDSLRGGVLFDQRQPTGTSQGSGEMASHLHRLANDLRVNGLLPQSIEAFRRALMIMPDNARLLVDFANCLRSYGSMHSDERAERKALAMMRLAERRAGSDAELLNDIGESYFQFGEWRRAGASFRKAIEGAGERFRSLIGLAELALHEGKIAHVIHNFSEANEFASTPAARRWTLQEIDYFSRLNEDSEYLELEISRLNMLDTLSAVRGTALRIALIGFPVIVFGVLFEQFVVANAGWAVSLLALTAWAVMTAMIQMLSSRIPPGLVKD